MRVLVPYRATTSKGHYVLAESQNAGLTCFAIACFFTFAICGVFLSEYAAIKSLPVGSNRLLHPIRPVYRIAGQYRPCDQASLLASATAATLAPRLA